MGEIRNVGGRLIERLPDGTFVEHPSDGGAQQMPADPTFPLKGPKIQTEIASAQANTTGQNIENSIKRTTGPAIIRKTNAEADKAEADAAASAAEAASKPSPSAIKASKDLSLDEVLGAIDKARGLTSGWSTGLAGQVFQPIGGTDARDLAGKLSTIGSALTVDKLMEMKTQSQTGASGMGALSEKEGALLRDSVSSLDQAQSEDAVRESLDAIDLHYRRLRAIKDGQNPNDQRVQQAYGIVGASTPPPPSVTPGGPSGGSPLGAPSGGPTLAPASGGNQTVPNPAMRGINARISGMVQSGASSDQIRSYLAQVGIDPAKVNGIEAQVSYRHRFPAYKGPYSVDLESMDVPMGAVGSAVNAAANSAPGAYAMNAADALTGQTLDNMTSNPAATRAAMSAASSEHPIMSGLGMMSGAALAASGMEAGLGAAGMRAVPAMMGADALYGAGYGAGSTDDGGSRLGGAVQGAMIGAGGGAIGRAAASGLGGMVRGVTDPAKRLLNDSGIPLTIGQMAGGMTKGIEDRLSGLPIVGGMINGQRAKGMELFQRAAFSDALAPIGQQGFSQIGEQGVQSAQDAVGNAYGAALDGVRVQTDPAFKQAIGQLGSQVQGIPRVGPELAASMGEIANPMFGPGGTLRGPDAQSIMQGMEQIKRPYRPGAMLPGDPLYATHIAPAVDSYTAQIEGLLQRQAPGTIPALKAANGANRNLSVVQDAVMASANKGGRFTPAQLMNASKANSKAFSGKRSTAAGKGPLFDLARAGNEVLPNQVPDSGTAGRLAMYGLLGGAYGGSDYASQPEAERSIFNSGTKALLGAAALAGGGKALRPIVQKGLFGSRPAKIKALGDFIARNPQLGSSLTIPMLIAAMDK